MAKRTINKDAVWNTINTETLPTSIKDAYAGYKDAYRDMKEAREQFEAIITKAIAPAAGKRVIFGYNFGKLSVAVVDDDKPASKPAAGSVSLSALVMR
jgi:hypothetical protein